MAILHFRKRTPAVLFKYLDVAGAWNTLRPDGWASVMFSRPDRFNDPFECFPAGLKLESDGNLRRTIVRVLKEHEKEARAECAKLGWQFEQVVEDFRSGRRSLEPHRSAILKSDGRGFQEAFAKTSGILSLSACHDHLAMWSYYAHNHEGLVLGFRTRAFLPLEVYPVEYSRKRPRLGETTDRDSIRKFTVKAPVWRHEREWRVVASSEYMKICRVFRGLPDWTDERILWEIEPANIDCVLLGVRCRDPSLLNRIAQFSAGSPLCRVLQAQQDRRKFKLNFINWRTNK